MLRKGVDTRAAIVRAALDLAAGGDWAATSLQAVRQRAGVSNGSLFHHFPTRRDLTSAVAAEALAELRAWLTAELADDARLGVTGVVRRHLAWVQGNPAVARLLLTAPPADPPPPSAGTSTGDRFAAAVADWLRAHGWTGRPDIDVVLALWTGPTREYARRWLASPSGPPVTEAADALAEGAWAAVRPLLGPDRPGGPPGRP